MPQRQQIRGNAAVVGRKAWASGTASCGPWKEPVVQELFGLPADDEGLLGSDGEDGAGESAEAVDGDAAVPAVNGIAVSIGRGDSVSGGRAAGVGITGSAVRRVLPRNSNRHSLLPRVDHHDDLLAGVSAGMSGQAPGHDSVRCIYERQVLPY